MTDTSAQPMAASTEPLPDEVIRTVDLTKVYPGDVKAVDQLNLTVHRGEIFGLLGPNGAGKTTTAGMLTTRVVPTEGRAFVGGVDVWEHPAKAKQLIGVVPQTNTLDRSLSVWENLYFHGRFFGMSTAKARSESDDMLERFKLTERAKMPVLALSGGMAQRLMVARAVMHRPSVLFLDEPTAGLDPQSRIAMWEILGDLHTDGQTILLTTHYMEEADQLCKRLAIIDHGKVLALDTPENLKRSTGIDTMVTVTADGDLEPLATLLEQEIEGATSALVMDGTVRLGVKGAKGVLPQVVQAAERKGINVTDLSITEPTLETVFIDLTGKDLPRMTTTTLPVDAVAADQPHVGTVTAFKALLLRDFYVLRKNLKEFIPRTILQPLLLVFVFAYVFPKIGQGVGGAAGAERFSTMLIAGVLASVIMFQGIQAVALPMVQEFGYTREIEDRVLAPLPVELVAIQKIISGALQCLLAALIVFPIAYFVPATPVHLEFNWLVLITVTPIACIMSAALGLMFGTLFDPRTVPLLFGIVVIPLTFLGCIYFPWAQLEGIKWLQIVVLVNPLVYMSEGFRAALTPVDHMALWAIYPILTGFTALFVWIGLKYFKKRVLS